ncbi:MAG: hypothetical protein ACYCU7_15170 [Acidimicrobiales bacterium]
MRSRFLKVRLLAVTTMLAVGCGAAVTPLISSPASAGTTTTTGGAGGAAPSPSFGGVVKAPTFTLPLTDVGQVDLAAAAAAQVRRSVAAVPQGAALAPLGSAGVPPYRIVDNRLLTHAPAGTPSNAPSPLTTALTAANVKGEHGFSAIGGVQQASTQGGTDLEPPDQGLCAGGGYVVEFVNNALAVYSASGAQLLGPIGSPAVFKQPSTDFFSDPHCYYDAPTKHWFLQEFIVGTVGSSGQELTPSLQFEAVSTGPDPTGTYNVWSWDTTDVATPGCPCFGDYDNLGADDNGIYVATDEFSIAGPAYNGVVLYAISKETLETAPQTGIVPPVFGYRLTKDPFGQPYIVSPASTPPGAKFAPNTEYFVESNGNALSDDHLMVYALNDTSNLASPAPTPPTLYRTEVKTEPYAFPNDATQKPGPRPLGTSVQDPPGGIQADFDAAMEPTYVGGQLYAELDTSTAGGSDAVDWFILQPSLSGGTLAATVAHQGVVAVPDASLLYPYTALDASGVGYLLFSLSGPHNYPSPAYISYNTLGPTGPVMLATPGAAPEDSFTCYAAFVGPSYGGCRWGDYSMGVAMGQRVFMATEMVPQGYRDILTNWGTYIWSAPPPIPAG